MQIFRFLLSGRKARLMSKTIIMILKNPNKTHQLKTVGFKKSRRVLKRYVQIISKKGQNQQEDTKKI